MVGREDRAQSPVICIEIQSRDGEIVGGDGEEREAGRKQMQGLGRCAETGGGGGAVRAVLATTYRAMLGNPASQPASQP